jgi:hypothetical protein
MITGVTACTKTKRKKMIDRRTEHEHQAALFEWAALMESEYPDLKYLFAIPNGGLRHKAVAAKLKKEGVKPGVPDTFLPVPMGRYHGLFIELKPKYRGIKRLIRPKPDKNQTWWLQHLAIHNFSCHCCRGVDAAKAVIIQYLKGEL